MVNRAANCVTVYEKAEDGTVVPVRAFICSCGREGHETPLGTFRTSSAYEWRLMVDGTYVPFDTVLYKECGRYGVGTV